jgi:5'-3' exonuclease
MGVNAAAGDARGRIYDYIFMCFLLGNDFLPHFPALNIRTHGNYTVLETYNRVIGNRPDRRFISLETGNIQWRWVKMYLKELASLESRTIKEDYVAREKMERRHYPVTTKEEREMAFDNIPVIYRAEEHYINPREDGWKSRYYRSAFHLNESPSKEFIRNVSINYLEGLEWVFKYYTEGCPHWRWKYNYHYPPLFADLIEYVPDFETTFIDDRLHGINRPFHSNTQLAYVIPPWNKCLLSSDTNRQIKKRGLQKYYVEMENLKFQWTFCRYFWESHALLPDISLTELEQLDSDFSAKSPGCRVLVHES